MIRLTFLAALLAAAPSAAAQTPGSCLLGTATTELSASDVRASLANTGRLFQDGFGAGYEVPRGGGVHAIFAAHLWFGGQVGGEVRTSASVRFDVQELWPGPLDDGATLPDPDDCSAFDRIYRVSAAEVAAYDAGGSPTPDLSDWPVGLGAPAVDMNGDAVVPADRTQTVDLAAGERPVIYGAETAFWVMNDVGNEHAFSATPPLGIEVRVSAFAVSAPAEPALDQATFYRVETLNRSAAPIETVRLGLWADLDLGDALDDYVGSDADRAMLYVYNSDDDDAGYGAAPPALGIDLLSGAGGAGFHYKNDGFLGAPRDASWIDAYLRSQWQDGTPLTRGGDGYQDGGEVTTWIWDGEPETRSFWSETDTAPEPGAQPNSPQDRRAFISSAPATLAPGGTSTVDIGIVYARGTDHLDSVAELRAASDVVQARYDDGSLFETVLVSDEPSAPTVGVRLGAPRPNPMRGDGWVGFALGTPGAVRLQIVDALGRTVATLTDRSYPAGSHQIEVGAHLAPGVYSLVLDAGGARTVRRLTVVR